MRTISNFVLFAVVGTSSVVGCSSSSENAASDSTTTDSGTTSADTDGATATSDSGSDATSTANGCTLAANTTASSVAAPSGCAVLARDTSACSAARTAAGLSGFWLKFSCRVTLGMAGGNVTITSDGQPDYLSNYFASSNACHEAYTGAIQNPNTIAALSLSMQMPATPDTSSAKMNGGIVGVAINGVPIFGNFAAPGDDIFQEAATFDRCGGHPQQQGQYHYHSEPFALSYDDANLIGVMRDGYPVYGRKDADGSTPTLDSMGGHTGVTADSPSAAVYHYHLNEQTSTSPGTAGQKQWFLTTGTYRGSAGSCTGCGM